MKKDYYQILGINKEATQDEVKKAFRKLAHEHHPDKKTGNVEKFKEANEAYTVLSDDSKRKQYDTFGSEGPGGGFQGGGFGGQGFGGFDFSQGFGGQGGGVEFDLGDIFGDIFGGGQSSRGRARKGQDISVDIQIPFKDSIFGSEKTVILNKTSVCSDCDGTGGKKGSGMHTCSVCGGQGKVKEIRRSMLGAFESVKTCDNCHGKGQVSKEKCHGCSGSGIRKKETSISFTIPSGVNDGESIRLPGAGEAITGGASGDLYIKFHVAKDSHFRKDGSNLITQLDIKLSEALLGAEKILQTLDGDVTIKIPEGSAHAEVLRVKGKGVPTSNSRRGDILVVLNLVMPKKLSKSARASIEALKKEGI